jgi:hypothetical protein
MENTMPNTSNDFLNWTADLDKKAEAAQLTANLKTITAAMGVTEDLATCEEAIKATTEALGGTQ